MKKQLLTLAGVVALAACLAARAEAAPFTFTFALDPADGAVAGAPGETVGWGFTIDNLDEDNWLEVTALDADPFVDGIPDSFFPLPIIEPSGTSEAPFVADTSGLYQFTIDAGAPLGVINTGTFTIFVQWWDGDPVSPNSLPLDPDDALVEASAPYSVTTEAAVPEPSMLLLVGVGLTAAGLRRRRL